MSEQAFEKPLWRRMLASKHRTPLSFSLLCV